MNHRLRLLYVGLEYDYGDPRRGHSYEYLNFLDTLRRMKGVEASFFPFDTLMRREGRRAMNGRLLTTVEESAPDVCFFVLLTDEIAKETIDRITRGGSTKTLGWFGDDHWRFLPYSRHWAPLFHHPVTTDSVALERYRRFGITTVIKSQWAFNHHVIVPQNLSEDYDVTFVGQVHSRRRARIDALRQAGISIECWGRGWDNGRLSHTEMMAMYARSRINLNFTESSVAAGGKRLAKIFLRRRADSTFHLNRPLTMAESARVLLERPRAQIKGRNFEVPGAGGFLLTQAADELQAYYAPGKEIAVFEDDHDCREKIRYYLAHAEEREAIRRAGYERTARDHTYERRFLDIFEAMGIHLGHPAAGDQ